MIRNKSLLVGIGVGIAAVRLLGHSPAMWIYLGLEVFAYCLVLVLLFWPTVIVEKGITVKTTTLAQPSTQELMLSPISSTSLASEGSLDSLQSTIRTLETPRKVDFCIGKQPLIRPLPGGFPKHCPLDTAPSHVSALAQPSSTAQVKLSLPVLPPTYDPEVESLREMNAFEAAALQRLSEVTKQVTDAVKSAKLQQVEAAPVLTHTPSIVDLPTRETEVIREGVSQDAQAAKGESAMQIESFNPSPEAKGAPIAVQSTPAFPPQTPAVNVSTISLHTNAFPAFATSSSAVIPAALTSKPTQQFPAFSQPPSNITHTVVPSTYQQVEMSESSAPSRTHLSTAIPSSTGFHRASVNPAPSAMEVISMQETRDTYASRLAAENRPLHLEPSSSEISALLEHIATKERLLPSLGEEARREITRFAYSLAGDSPGQSQLRKLKDRLSVPIQRSSAPLFFLCEQLIKLNVDYFRQSNGLVLADYLVRWVSVLAQEWTQLERLFVLELQTQEPSLHPSARSHSTFTSIKVPLARSYSLAILYGFLMRTKSKVTLSDAWTLLASFVNSPYDASSARIPAVAAGLLRVVGSDMSSEYAHQFRKLVNLILNDYLKDVPLNDPAQMYVREISYLTMTGKFKPPIDPVSKV